MQLSKTLPQWIVNRETTEAETEHTIVRQLGQYLKKLKDLLKLIEKINKEVIQQTRFTWEDGWGGGGKA